VQQFSGIPRMYRKAGTVEKRAGVQRGVPTAAHSRQIHMAGTSDCPCRLIECGTSAAAKKVNHPLQFFGLAKDIAQKVGHGFETWILLRNRFQKSLTGFLSYSLLIYLVKLFPDSFFPAG
jgi:hypothetical protein